MITPRPLFLKRTRPGIRSKKGRWPFFSIDYKTEDLSWRNSTRLSRLMFKNTRMRRLFFKTFCYIFTWILPTFGTRLNASLLTAPHHAVPAPVFRLTSWAGNFVDCSDMIAISDSHPKVCRMLQFFFWLLKWMCHISRACWAVIPAGSDYFFL